MMTSTGLLAGQPSTSTWCQPCSVVLGPENPAEEHNRSRSHLNRLLQLGMEIPLDETSTVDTNCLEGNLPEMPWCSICETVVGETPLQAAQHYRSREHINKRLQKGLPVAVGATAAADGEDNTDHRHYLNHCLRRGIQPSTLLPQNGSAPTAPVLPGVPAAQEKVVNGKRKLPVPNAGVLGLRSPSGTVTQTFSHFAQEKRACRPILSVQKLSPDVGLNNTPGCRPLASSAHFGMPLSAGSSSLPGSNFYRPSVRAQTQVRHTVSGSMWNATAGFETVQPAMATRGYGDQMNPSSMKYDQSSFIYNPSGASLYNEQGTMFNDGWFCDLCNVALPTAIALSQHTNSAEHRWAAECSRMRGQSSALFQPS